MIKIDISKIEGYDAMTPEEKLSALENYEYEDNAEELERYKNAVTKANKEAAEWKRKHNELLDDDEKKKQDTEEELTTLRTLVDTYEKEKKVASNKAHYLALGYDEELAGQTAQLLVDGEIDKVFENHKKFLESHDKTMKADLLKKTPRPDKTESPDTMTLKTLKEMPAAERYNFSVDHPEEYKKLYGGNE